MHGENSRKSSLFLFLLLNYVEHLYRSLSGPFLLIFGSYLYIVNIFYVNYCARLLAAASPRLVNE